MEDTKKFKLAFLGSGKMATAIAKGLIKTGIYKSEEIVGTSRTLQTRELFS